MSEARNMTFEAYARRRFMLAGASVTDTFPYCRPLETLSADEGSGRPIVSFAHYDYLGLANDPRLAAAAHNAIEQYGVGAHASRLVGGELAEHRSLERDLADFIGVDDALALVSGYGANVTVVSHVMGKDDLVIYDEASHNSIISGAQASRAERCSFRHNDYEHLDQLLKKDRSRFGRVLVVIEGLYSMDGDIPNLPRILEICRSHAAWLMIDEAHSIGVLGCSGRGICEHFGVDPTDVDLIVGTLSKAFNGCGGFIAAKKSIVDWLRYTLPGFVYSVGMSPPLAATARAAIRILQDEPSRLRRLEDNSRYFLLGAHRSGLNVGSADGIAVVPILFPSVETTIAAANAALAAGYYVPPIVQIAVPKDAPRLRFFLTTSHRTEDIDRVIEAIKSASHSETYDVLNKTYLVPESVS